MGPQGGPRAPFRPGRGGCRRGGGLWKSEVRLKEYIFGRGDFGKKFGSYLAREASDGPRDPSEDLRLEKLMPREPGRARDHDYASSYKEKHFLPSRLGEFWNSPFWVYGMYVLKNGFLG